jgi:hypothetical protein
VTYLVLRYVHLLGVTLLGAGLIGVWHADLRSRQIPNRDLAVLAELVRQMAVFYDGLVVPGALLLLGSGTWLTVTVYGGWAALGQPWLAGMIALFAVEVIEGNSVTRLDFTRLRRLAQAALAQGTVTPELAAARRESLPTFTHFLDLPIFFLIVALGAMRPSTWRLFLVGLVIAIVVAATLTLTIPRMYPFSAAARTSRSHSARSRPSSGPRSRVRRRNASDGAGAGGGYPERLHDTKPAAIRAPGEGRPPPALRGARITLRQPASDKEPAEGTGPPPGPRRSGDGDRQPAVCSMTLSVSAQRPEQINGRGTYGRAMRPPPMAYRKSARPKRMKGFSRFSSPRVEEGPP